MRRLKANVEPNEAVKILAEVPSEKAFHFYKELGVPIGLVARSLKELLTIIQTVEIKSIEFHVTRKDFENWVTMLGDKSLARQLARLRRRRLRNEELRQHLAETFTKRYESLKSV